MSIALEMRSVVKRFEAGAGSCRAACAVLRGVDLAVAARESVTIIGPRGAGASTLLLCAAGLLVPDEGEIAWFGERTRAGALSSTRYVEAPNPASAETVAPRTDGRILLVDAPRGLDAPALAWLARRRSRGDTIVVATHDAETAACIGARTLSLRGGRLEPAHAPSARVAERAWRRAGEFVDPPS